MTRWQYIKSMDKQQFYDFIRLLFQCSNHMCGCPLGRKEDDCAAFDSCADCWFDWLGGDVYGMDTRTTQTV